MSRVSTSSAILLTLFAYALLAGSARGAALTVCSSGCDYTVIQDAVDNANPGDTILLGPETFYESVSVDKNLTILGAGPEQSIVDGSYRNTVFGIGGSGVTGVTLAAMTIQNGQSEGGGGLLRWDGRLDIDGCVIRDNSVSPPGAVGAYGGGILSRGNIGISNSVITGNRGHAGGGGVAITDRYDRNPGPVEISSTTISDNRANGGGGIMIYRGGWGRIPVIRDSTITGNTGGGAGGGGLRVQGSAAISNSTVVDNIANYPGIAEGGGLWLGPKDSGYVGEVTVSGATIAGNSPDGVFIDSGGNSFSAELRNTIVANNEDVQCAGDGAIISNGYNLSSDTSCNFTRNKDIENTDPLLIPLADNGGPTWTCELLPASPAIDAGGPDCEPTDQRGFARPVDGDGHAGAKCDIGSFEYGSTGPPVIVEPEVE